MSTAGVDRAEIVAVRWATDEDRRDPYLEDCGICGQPIGESALVVTTDEGEEYGRCHAHRPRDWEPCGRVDGVEKFGPYDPTTDAIDQWIHAYPEARGIRGSLDQKSWPPWRVEALEGARVAYSGSGPTLPEACKALAEAIERGAS